MNKSSSQLSALLQQTSLRRGAVFGVILFVALIAFEVFNFITTDFALTDLLGKDLTFAGIRWATILSIAFCGIDFAGIARLFTPEQGKSEPAEVWYLFGAWLLAAAMNATLTWWGISVAVRNHTALGSAVVGQEIMLTVVPVFVAIMVWLIRVLIIGTFSLAGDRLFSIAEEIVAALPQHSQPASRRSQPQPVSRPVAPRPTTQTPTHRPVRPSVEPTYHPVGMAAKEKSNSGSSRSWR